MLTFLELLTAIFGTTLLYRETVQNKFVNYATSVFLLAFVPLLCIYPVIARVAVGGAYTVRPGFDQVITDPWAYVIYQACCWAVLLPLSATVRPTVANPPLIGWRDKYAWDFIGLTLCLGIVAAGVAMYVYSTGFSVAYLISASRFEWFENESYSPVLFVISSYLVAFSPVAMLLILQNKQNWKFAVALVAILVLSGLLAKDRKWLIYMISAAFAYVYIKNGFTIKIRTSAIVVMVLVVAALAFWQIFRGVLFSYYLTGAGDPWHDARELGRELLIHGDFPYYYNASITAIDLSLNENFIIPFAVLRRELFFFLPANFSFGLKVEDISASFSDAIGAGDRLRRGNMPPGLFGLFIVSFKWFGALLASFLLPFGLRFLDRYIHRNRGLGAMVVAAHMLSAATLLLRGDDSSAVYFIISSMALIFGLRLLLGPFLTRRIAKTV